jgi:HNH endonuclease
MKHIKEVRGLDGTKRTLAEVAEEYFISLTLDKKVGKGSGKNGIDYHSGKTISYGTTSLIGRFKAEIEKNNAFQPFLNKYKRLKSILLALPNEFATIIQEFDKYLAKKRITLHNFSQKKSVLSEFRSILENIFAYKSLVDNNWLGKKLNIKVCPYCNNQYTQTLEKEDGTNKVQFQLDHFYPKSIYPYLAISFYNLIPSCANCNLAKSNHETFSKPLVHPYEESFHHLAKFQTDETTDKSLVTKFLETGNFRVKNIDIELVDKGDKRVKSHKDLFHLEEIYKQHQDVISEIYAKSHLYPSTRIDELAHLFDKDKLSLFTEEEIKRFILGNYTEEENFDKRPLSKLTHDIAKELGLI